jgi:hypothetical protein
MNPLARLSIAAGFAGVSLASSLASAHVRLTYPTPRYPTPAMMNSSTDIKTGPCGRANDSRTTDMSRVTVLEPGATIAVRFTETVDHPGFYRISFDNDGQDAFVAPTMRSQVQTAPPFTMPTLVDNITDIEGGGMYTTMVTLPNVECERCTLQLIQVMVANSVNSWTATGADPDIYFTCADIALRRTGGMGGAGGMAGTGGAGTAGAAGTGGPLGGTGGVATGGSGGLGGTGGSDAGAGGSTATGGVATGGTATGGTASGGVATGGSAGAPASGGTAPSGGAPAGGTTATGGTGTNGADDNALDEEGGCRMAPAGRGGHVFLAAAALALGVALRRRRGSRSAAA